MSIENPFHFVSLFQEMLDQNKVIYSVCEMCDRNFLPPQKKCLECEKGDLEIREAPKTGKIETYTIIHVSTPDFKSEVPFAIGIISLGDNLRIMGRIQCSTFDELSIGREVKMCFNETKNDSSRLYFQVSDKNH
jgi:uncharacterized OB-fold protein